MDKQVLIEQFYPMYIYQNEYGDYNVIFPDLLGCVAGGNTIEEVLEMAEDTKRGWIEIALEDNKIIPLPNKHLPITIRDKYAPSIDENDIKLDRHNFYFYLRHKKNKTEVDKICLYNKRIINKFLMITQDYNNGFISSEEAMQQIDDIYTEGYDLIINPIKWYERLPVIGRRLIRRRMLNSQLKG